MISNYVLKTVDFVWGRFSGARDGRFRQSDLILGDLINSPEIQRLKGIDQYGISKLFASKKGFSRYEHSVGVMLCLRKFGADLKTQIKGLLHDVSHTAFSHTTEVLFGGDTNEDSFQDRNHEYYIANSSLPRILKNYGYDINDIISLDSNLLDNELPNICADRLDYALREFYHEGNPRIVNSIVSDLAVKGDAIVFKSKNSARLFAENYMDCQMEHWASAYSVVKGHLLSKLFEMGIDNDILNLSDFWKDDMHILDKLRKSRVPEVRNLYAALSSNIRLYKINNIDPQLILHKKFRWVDPIFVQGKKFYRLSEEDETYAQLLDNCRSINEEGIKVDLLINLQK